MPPASTLRRGAEARGERDCSGERARRRGGRRRQGQAPGKQMPFLGGRQRLGQGQGADECCQALNELFSLDSVQRKSAVRSSQGQTEQNTYSGENTQHSKLTANIPPPTDALRNSPRQRITWRVALPRGSSVLPRKGHPALHVGAAARGWVSRRPASRGLGTLQDSATGGAPPSKRGWRGGG